MFQGRSLVFKNPELVWDWVDDRKTLTTSAAEPMTTQNEKVMSLGLPQRKQQSKRRNRRHQCSGKWKTDVGKKSSVAGSSEEEVFH